jgi:hypothetical protein
VRADLPTGHQYVASQGVAWVPRES